MKNEPKDAVDPLNEKSLDATENVQQDAESPKSPDENPTPKDADVPEEPPTQTGEELQQEETVATKSESAVAEEDKTETPAEVKSEEETPEVNDDGAEESEDDDDHEDEADPYANEDFSTYNAEQILKTLGEVALLKNVKRADALARELKQVYDLEFNKRRDKALEKFLAEGGEEGDFQFKGDENTQKIEEYFKLIRDKKQDFFRDLEKQKDENLQKKTELLETLRHLVDGEESQVSMSALKKIQTEWRSIGPVPGSQNKTLWANYNALIDRFYDNRSIYFELKELDRKKNLEAKLELCQKAELLAALPNLKDAIKQLNELHEEFKHVGPVPRESQEELWQRFKSASDVVYARRKEFVDKLKVELKQNLDLKLALAETAETFPDFSSDRITEWNQKTKELLDLQKKWDAIGGLPKDQAKSVNKKFWSAFKTFFANKNKFFKQLESLRDENLLKKQALVAQAEELKDSEEWAATAEQLKRLQSEWKNIGPVPEKARNEIYKRFKTACDQFFNRKREQGKSGDKDYEKNLVEKEAICAALEKIGKSPNVDPEEVYALQEKYNGIGFVPRGAMKKLQTRYDSALEKIGEVVQKNSGEDAVNIKANISINKFKSHAGGDSQRSNNKEFALKKKISQLENDLSTWKTNVQFLASSAKADKLKEQFEAKIDEAAQEIEVLKEQLKILQQS